MVYENCLCQKDASQDCTGGDIISSMAKRGRKRAKPRKQQKKKDNKNQEEGLKRSVVKEIVAILLITVAVFLVLALIGVAGSLGVWTLTAVRFVIGQAVYALPFALLLMAFMLFAQEKYPLRVYNVIGIISFFICLSTIIQAATAPEVGLQISSVGQYGGIVGYAVYSVVSPILNKPVTIFIFSMLMLVSVIVAANARLKQIIKKILSPLRKEKGEEDKKEDQNFKINTLPIKGTIGKSTKEEPKPEVEPIVSSTDKDWKYPSLDLLESTSTEADPGDAKKNAEIIRSTFDEFGYEVKMEGVDVGPTVAQYALRPPSGVNLSKISALDRNLALALEAQQIRIEAPIPGKSQVGIEVPNKKAATVRLRDILASKDMEQYKSKLSFVLGRDVSGEIIAYDLAKAPHLLVAGATGSGKSVLINTILASLLYRNSPSELKLILVDPKRVEMTLYNDIPHLLSPVIFEPDKTISALKWAVAEMERRLKLLSEHGKRNIGEYNQQKGVDHMPYIVIVIDELYDLMLAAGKDVEALIQRIAQMARAVGIHLVLATQRPSVNVITGTIKANVPTRVALTTASQVDSRTIIDVGGAEKLLGKGDMLFSSPEFIKPKRVQGVYLSEREVSDVAKFLREQRDPQYNEEVLAQAVKLKGMGGSSVDMDGADDDLFNDAAEIVIQSGKASASLLQRRLRVGYARAARLIDLLEEQGVVGPADGARPREVLVSSLNDVTGDDSESA